MRYTPYDMLKERQKTILEAVIEEHIRTARPIASREIMDELEFAISPATIRNEMLKLDELGYLEQPHTSAGRIPTDHGYRYYVDELEEHSGAEKNNGESFRDIFRENDYEEFARDLSKTLSRLTNSFAVVMADEEDAVFENGFSRLLEEPEFQDLMRVKEFGNLIDLLGEELSALAKNFDENGDIVFIGEENPLKEAHSYTMLLSRWTHPQGFSGFFTLVGPKRMDYRKNMSLIRYLHEHYGE